MKLTCRVFRFPPGLRYENVGGRQTDRPTDRDRQTEIETSGMELCGEGVGGG